mgnify:CR=1 FL=1
MRNLLTFIRKEFLHILRDPKSLMIMVLLPLIEILLFGFILRFEIESTNIAVYDPTSKNETGQLIRHLEGTGRFKVRYVNSPEEAEDLMKSGKVKAVLNLSADFERRLLDKRESAMQMLLDASDPNTAVTIESYLNASIALYLGSLSSEAQVSPVEAEPLLYYNPTMKSVYAIVPGLIAVVLMLICALMSSISLTREKEMGTLKVLLISPLKPMQIIVGKLSPYLIVSSVNIAVILITAFTVFRMPLAGSLFALLAVSLLYCLCALSLGFLISTKAQSQQVAMMISLAGLMLPTTLLSGMLYPIKNMPMWLQTITCIMPARWFIDTLKHIMLKASPLSAYIGDVAILAGMTLTFTILSLKNFQIRYR